MDKAAFEQLETITNRVTTFLMKLVHTTTDVAVRHAIIIEVNELTQNLVRERNEQKGDPR